MRRDDPWAVPERDRVTAMGAVPRTSTYREQVEMVAEALHLSDAPPPTGRREFEHLLLDEREDYRARARSALDAIGIRPRRRTTGFPAGIVAIGSDPTDAARAAWMVRLAQILRERVTQQPRYTVYMEISQ